MDFSAIVQQCTPPNVSVYTMHQIASVESAHQPHAIGFKLIRTVRSSEGGKEKVRREISTLRSQPKNREEAVQWARYLLAAGYEFDAGAAQIHSTNFASYGLTVETVFDACNNVRAGALILTDCYRRALERFKLPATALQAALSCYQSGNFQTGFHTGYVQKVVAAQVPHTVVPVPSLP